MLRKVSLIVACFGMLFAAAGARADDWNKKTTITFTEPVAIPGDIVLPAGTYVFRIMDVGARRDVVQVFNAEENHVFATIFAIPEVHINRLEKPWIGFEERGEGMPAALHEWRYAGDFGGIEFVYR